MKPGDYKLEINKDGMLTYRYCWDGGGKHGIELRVSLLSEVGEGQGFRAAFKELTAGMNIETRELDKAPWFADFVVKGKTK